MKGLESLERVFTGLEEITVEEKRPREGRPVRNLEAPGAVGFESDGCEVEPSIGAWKMKFKPKKKRKKNLTAKRERKRERVSPSLSKVLIMGQNIWAHIFSTSLFIREWTFFFFFFFLYKKNSHSQSFYNNFRIL